MAFTLGYNDRNGYTCKQSQCQANYALVSDAPGPGIWPDLVSKHHDGRGENVVFADGRVKYILGCGDDECGDPIFWNRDNLIAPGLDHRDNVLATSGHPILPVVHKK
jgi:hypothetical protein